MILTTVSGTVKTFATIAKRINVASMIEDIVLKNNDNLH